MVPTGKATSMSPEEGKYILLKDGSTEEVAFNFDLDK